MTATPSELGQSEYTDGTLFVGIGDGWGEDFSTKSPLEQGQRFCHWHLMYANDCLAEYF